MDQILSLDKGQSLCLDKPGAKLLKAIIGLGWMEKPSMQTGADFDLDSCVLLLQKDGTVGNVQDDFIFPSINETHSSRTVRHGGDNVNGGDGINPDENIEIDLASVPEKYTRIMVLVSIYKAVERNQNFGLVDKSFAIITNPADDSQIARMDIQNNLELGTATAVHFGTFIKDDNGNWNFKNESIGFPGGLPAFFQKYKVSVTGG